jgi:MYXO-CTERM domain-containing protein
VSANPAVATTPDTLSNVGGVTGPTSSDVTFNIDSVTTQLAGTDRGRDDRVTLTCSTQAVPGPAGVGLLGLGAFGLLAARRLRRRA